MKKDERPFYKTKRFYFGLIFFYFLFKIFSPSPKENYNYSENTDNNKVPFFELLSESSPGGNYVNLNFLVKTEKPDSILLIAKEIRKKYCLNKDCNSVNFWLNENSFNSYLISKTKNTNSGENQNWKRKNWSKICESNIAEVYFSSKEISIYPMISDSFEYAKFGGKKKRPEVQEILIDN